MSADFDWLMTSRDELILDCSTVLQLILYHNKQHWPYSYSQLQKNMTKMPKRCVVGRCGAVNNDGISLHKCPKEEKTRKLWVKFVQLTRTNFTKASSFSCICSLHFNSSCFKSNMVADSRGFGTRYGILLQVVA